MMIMNKFRLDDDSEFLAEDMVDGYLINPLCLNGVTPNSPFVIQTDHQFSVHCRRHHGLKCLGVFDSLDAAITCAKLGPSWRIKCIWDKTMIKWLRSGT